MLYLNRHNNCFKYMHKRLHQKHLKSVKAALASNEIEHKAETKKRVVPHKSVGQAWEDLTLADWPKSTNYFSLLLFTICLYLIYMILRPDLLVYNGCRLIFIIF